MAVVAKAQRDATVVSRLDWAITRFGGPYANPPAELIEAQVVQLSPKERTDLADKIWLIVHSSEDVDAAWDVEVARRMAEVDSGAVECVPRDTVMAELRTKLR